MSLKKNLLFALTYAALWFSTPSKAKPCDHPAAPAAFAYIPPTDPHSGKPNGNFGIRPSDFVSLRDGTAVVHGIDVSKYQDQTNFALAYQCGARFAYVRLSGGTSEVNDDMYRVHWPNARASGFLVGPYHNLSIVPGGAQKWYGATGSDRQKKLAELELIARSAGRTQARLFLSHLDEILSFEAKKRGATPKYLPIALDISNDPLPKATPAERVAFKNVYANAVCSFIKAVHSNEKTRTSQVILFAKPVNYMAYRLNDASCGLNRLQVWISYHSKNGDRYGSANHGDDAKAVAYLCHPLGKQDRCMMQQYTSLGGFAVFKPGAPLDLDRFYGDSAALNALLETY